MVVIVLTFIVIGYLESPYSLFNKQYATISSIPYEVAMSKQAETVSTNEGPSEKEEITALNFSLDMVLENKSEVDGVIVETYQEYEIYKDENGKVVKKIPTSHFDYLRYQK